MTATHDEVSPLAAQALREAMQEEMRKDDRVFLMGEEVAEYIANWLQQQGVEMTMEEAGRSLS